MPAETLFDPKYRLPTTFSKVGNRDIPLIVDPEGNWFPMSCASEPDAVPDLVAHFSIHRQADEVTFEQLKPFFCGSAHETIISGVGLFFYRPPELPSDEDSIWGEELTTEL